jgi:BMFP domain-containing protein YqiC
MGFIRQQEQRLALRLLTWQYQRMNIALPDQTELETRAAKLVEDAHHIARERGRNVMTIIKELVQDLKKK